MLGLDRRLWTFQIALITRSGHCTSKKRSKYKKNDTKIRAEGKILNSQVFDTHHTWIMKAWSQKMKNSGTFLGGLLIDLCPLSIWKQFMKKIKMIFFMQDKAPEKYKVKIN